jgi:predicted alpha/beta superfamily hydrolase
MHDGQNLFDPRSSYIGVDWGVDEALGGLIDAGEVDGAIVVGIWCTDRRRREYLPQRPFETEEGRKARARLGELYGRGPIESDAYLMFLVKELKPFIDARYRTLPDRDHTLVMGSSMGGLISLYALCEYPEVFVAAGCLSTHWPPGEGIIVDYLEEALPPPGTHRFYFDYGTETLDQEYEVYQKRVDEVMKRAGYQEGEDWVTRKFVGAEHSERAWRARVHIPLRFLLAGNNG